MIEVEYENHIAKGFNKFDNIFDEKQVDIIQLVCYDNKLTKFKYIVGAGLYMVGLFFIGNRDTSLFYYIGALTIGMMLTIEADADSRRR